MYFACNASRRSSSPSASARAMPSLISRSRSSKRSTTVCSPVSSAWRPASDKSRGRHSGASRCNSSCVGTAASNASSAAGASRRNASVENGAKGSSVSAVATAAKTTGEEKSSGDPSAPTVASRTRPASNAKSPRSMDPAPAGRLTVSLIAVECGTGCSVRAAPIRFHLWKAHLQTKPCSASSAFRSR